MKDISKGYIALFRQFIDWEWFTDINTCHLFIYCLLRANIENTKWKGIELKKGQFITSYSKLSEETGLTYKQVRLGINKLKRTGEVAHEGYSSYSIITIKNWNRFQNEGRQQGRQRATDNNKRNNIINNIISLSIEEREILKKYILNNKKNIQDIDAYIRKLLDNGDVVNILEKAKRWEEKQKKKGTANNEVTEVQVTESEEEIKKAMKAAREKVNAAIRRNKQ